MGKRRVLLRCGYHQQGTKVSSLNALRKVMAPPARPVETTNGGGWQFIQVKLGITLPEDYKEFVSTFGTGAVDSFLWVLNPFSKNDNLNLINCTF